MEIESIPKTQYAIQLTGPNELRLNAEKAVNTPGPHQMLVRTECVGLCFSDLKLLSQFSSHARKSDVLAGLSPEILAEIPSYVPNATPTVPGHEVVCRIIAVGDAVAHHRVGERCLVQADFRQLPTANSNAAFGYNFEGALQEYVLLDERVVMNIDGERYLVPVPERLGASQAALVEPWACVEDSYVNNERRTIKTGGRLLVVADAGHTIDGLTDSFDAAGPPAAVTYLVAETAQEEVLRNLGVAEAHIIDGLDDVADEAFDDITYFGAQKATIDVLNDKLAGRGIINIVTGGAIIGQVVSVGVGRVHYGFTRWVGTRSIRAADGYAVIPETGEIRDGDVIAVIGAGGPMGQMHVIRNICSGKKGIAVTAADIDDRRLESLAAKCRDLAAANGVELRFANIGNEPLSAEASYWALMAPLGALVADAIKNSRTGALINIFAGIPAPTRHDLDLDTYIDKRCYMFGTSGSTIEDMKIVLRKVTDGQLNTDTSVDAVAGMQGAADGVEAVKNRSLAGKIIVYPQLHDVGLIPLNELRNRFPTVAEKLDDGRWCQAAEEALLQVAGRG